MIRPLSGVETSAAFPKQKECLTQRRIVLVAKLPATAAKR